VMIRKVPTITSYRVDDAPAILQQHEPGEKAGLGETVAAHHD
jgi:hypothetical protein